MTATLLSLVVQGAGVLLTWLVSESLGLRVPLLYFGIVVPLVSLLTLLPISLKSNLRGERRSDRDIAPALLNSQRFGRFQAS